jgi:hypothetical protein
MFELPRPLVRIGALASVAAGVLLIAGFALHPSGEDATFGTDPFWVPAHVLLWASFTIALIGWFALYSAQAARAGSLGVVAYVVILLGTSFASWIFSSDVTFVPVIAAESPALFKKIFSGGHVIVGITSVLSWVTGNVLFGVSVMRARVFPPWSGLLLAVGTATVPITYLAGVSLRVTAAGAALAGVGQIWLGIALQRSLASHDPTTGRA